MLQSMQKIKPSQNNFLPNNKIEGQAIDFKKLKLKIAKNKRR